MSFIILTKAQADSVRGVTSPGFALNPIQQMDGTYFLPDRVLDDPAHASKHGFLSSLPRSETIHPIQVEE